MARPIQQKTSLGELRRGDQIAIKMRTAVVIAFKHHAIVEDVYTSPEKVNVIHRVQGKTEGGKIVRGTYEAKYGPFFVVIHSNRRYNRAQTYNRAKERIGEEGYNLRDQNCEHFANWCVMGEEKSFQAEDRYLACTICQAAIEKKAEKAN